METTKPIQVNIPRPQHGQQPKQQTQVQAAMLHDGRPRTLSVAQALQFTPLTTSILPAHDRIPMPQISRARESARFTSTIEKKAMVPMLAEYPGPRVKERFQGLLRSDLIPEYKFKQNPSTDQLSTTSNQNAQSSEVSLSPFARMILEMTAIDYNHPLQRNPARQSQPASKSDMTYHEAKSATQQAATKIQASNVPSLAGPNGHMPLVTKPLPKPISINLPKPVIEADLKSHTADKGALDRHPKVRAEPVVQISLHVRSQRDAADAALQQFQNFLLELFEAQDQLDAGSTAVFDAGFFDHADESEDTEPTLSSRTMERLLVGLKKLITMKNLYDLSAEHLRRLQILCEPSIDRLQTMNLRLSVDADANEQQIWQRNVQKADAGLLSANVFLHTILAPSPDESLIVTEALSWIPSALRNIFENCLIPCVEARPDEASSSLFRTALSCREDVKKLLEAGRRVVDLASAACTQTRGLESTVNPIEFLAAKLIFVQNAIVDKNSTLGIQTFEKVRKTAMTSLARIFARFPAERSAILDEVLTSLDKLPSNSRSARQYRLGDGKNVQLISALFMQLVQNTALETPDSHLKRKRAPAGQRLEDDDNDEHNEEDGETEPADEEGSDLDDVLTKLQKKGNKLFDVAARSAQEIVLYLVGRASKTTKTGDSPYRNVLDLFIEDMVTVLSLPEWPSSELMLRIMAAKMIDMAQNEKTASAKNMALECLGTMGSAISILKASLPRQCASLSRDGRSISVAAEQLCKLAMDQDQGGVRNEDLIAFNGPFAIVSRHLWMEADRSLRNLSACGFFLAQYAKVMSLVVDANSFDENDIEAEPVRVANFLFDSIAQIGSGSAALQTFDAVSPEEAELAYSISVLNMGFCRRFSVIVKTLSSSFSSEQAMVRSRSLKSVVTMLETDSTLLDRDPTIADDVFRCASDDSAMVRDSALSLIARFVIAKPALEQKGIQRLLECASDAKVGVQKRAIGHLKDIYIKDTRTLLRATISRVILKRTIDHEESVSELAKKTLIEIWITPALAQLSHSADMAKTKVAIEDLASDIVSCISYDTNALCPLLRKFLKSILTTEKATAKARELCGKIVDVLFEKTISNQDDRNPLVVLTAFAEADPVLIPPPNLGKLQPYLGNLKTENDLFVFKAVISIFGCVLPHLSATHKPLLLETQNALMKAISFLGRRTELDTVMSCLQVIDGVLQNTMRLIKLAGSIMLKIKSGSASLVKSQDIVPQLLKLIRIAGAMGRYIDLENYRQQFATEVKVMSERSVAGYIANTLLPLTHANQPQKIRLLALESLGSVCQAFPGQFNNAKITKTFFAAFDPDTDSEYKESLQAVVLKVFEELYAHRAQSKEGSEDSDETPEKQELGKLGGDSRTRDGDSAISMITSSVAKYALAIALSEPSDNALIATKTLASISHQGLNHPKHSLLAFVALSTCPDTRIAAVAHDAHQLLHQQHGSVCEREYMTAIHEAYEYQQNVLKDPQGARQPTYSSKLAACFEIVNTSGTKYVKKFISGLVSRVSAKLSVEDGALLTEQVSWTLFAVQNLVFFEFSKVDEVLHAVLQLELAYSKKGVEISQLLETALATEEAPVAQDDSAMTADDQPRKDAERLSSVKDISTIYRLAPLAAILTIMMEGRAYLKRQYGVGRDVRTAISNSKQAKDTTKAPTKVYGITGERFWTKSNAVVAQLEDDEGRILCCQNFVDMMRTDEDVNVDEEDPLGEAPGSVGPPEVHDFIRSNTPGGIKRKLSVSATSTPAKRGPGRPRKEFRRSASMSSADDLDTDFVG